MTRSLPPRTLTLPAALIALLTAALPAPAQYTWNNPAGGNWSAGSSWQGGTPPAPGATTALTFGTAATQSSTYTATDDIGPAGTPFDLNALTVNNSAGTVTLAGNPLNFTGTSPTITVAGAGGMVLSQAATLAATTTVAGAGTGDFTSGSVLTGGSNNLVKTSAGSLTLAGGGAFNSLQLAAGTTNVTGGTLALTQPTTTTYTAFGLQLGLASGQTAAFKQTGGRVNVTEDVSLGDAAGSTGTATVTGGGTVFDTTTGGHSGAILVGKDGTGGLSITSGGVVNAVQVYAGYNSGSSGSVTVDGAGSALNFRTNGFSELWIGASGTGALTVSNGGRVNSTHSALTANDAGSTGTMTVTGAGSTLTVGTTSLPNTLSVGLGGTGTLNVQSGGQVVVYGSVFTAYYPGSQATTNVTDAGSSLTVSQRLTLGGAGTTVGGTGTLNVGSGGTVTVGGSTQVFTGGTINLNAGGTLAVGNLADATSTSAGAVHLAAGTALTITNGGATFSGVASGAGGLTMTGTDVQTLAGASTYTGPTTVSAGTLKLTGSGSIAGSQQVIVGTAPGSSAVLDVSGVTGGANFSGGHFALAGGQALQGSGGTVNAGSAGLLARSGSTIAPGSGGLTTGVLTVNGDTTFASGSTFAVAVNGTAAGTGYGRLAVNGAVTLGSATLSVQSLVGTTFSATDRVFILVNDGLDPITGTFSGLGEGASVTVGGYDAQISYLGNAEANLPTGGNDVVLYNFQPAPVLEPAGPLVPCAAAALTYWWYRRRRRPLVGLG